MENDSAFKLTIIEYDEYYLNSFDSTYTIPSLSSLQYGRWAKTYTYNTDTASNRPYIEYSTGEVSAPTNNATFFGTNF